MLIHRISDLKRSPKRRICVSGRGIISKLGGFQPRSARAAFTILTALILASHVNCAAADSLRIFDGIQTHFEIRNPVLRRGVPLKIRLTLYNISPEKKTFVYPAGFISAMSIFDEAGKMVTFKVNAPNEEGIAEQVDLDPGKETSVVADANIWEYFDLMPGRYFLQFRYDLRNIRNRKVRNDLMKHYSSDDYVVWDARRYFFEVH